MMKSTNDTYPPWSKVSASSWLKLRLDMSDSLLFFSDCVSWIFCHFWSVSLCKNLKFWQKSLTDFITCGFFWVRELAGLVYINHSIEKSTKLSNLLNSRGNVSSLFSWTCNFFRLRRDPSFSGKRVKWLSLSCKYSSCANRSNPFGRIRSLLLDATIVLRQDSFYRSYGSLVS